MNSNKTIDTNSDNSDKLIQRLRKQCAVLRRSNLRLNSNRYYWRNVALKLRAEKRCAEFSSGSSVTANDNTMVLVNGDVVVNGSKTADGAGIEVKKVRNNRKQAAKITKNEAVPELTSSVVKIDSAKTTSLFAHLSAIFVKLFK